MMMMMMKVAKAGLIMTRGPEEKLLLREKPVLGIVRTLFFFFVFVRSPSVPVPIFAQYIYIEILPF